MQVSLCLHHIVIWAIWSVTELQTCNDQLKTQFALGITPAITDPCSCKITSFCLYKSWNVSDNQRYHSLSRDQLWIRITEPAGDYLLPCCCHWFWFPGGWTKSNYEKLLSEHFFFLRQSSVRWVLGSTTWLGESTTVKKKGVIVSCTFIESANRFPQYSQFLQTWLMIFVGKRLNFMIILIPFIP